MVVNKPAISSWIWFGTTISNTWDNSHWFPADLVVFYPLITLRLLSTLSGLNKTSSHALPSLRLKG
ncbi:hypothetical protein FOPG_19703 [Fusarium oxysporum f. sp. conglutinans race 2 54008]|uniref:Uncharacterized protein n=1 Tax=Fusarium oxysporum f. sp. conglutinans race 2 54008 TaxID=1089457 RepID=X0GK64_FUSOX|nr:hypothetical protein FOPG_19770 [Fusarium oxysporum f. sp. conglutinans race 2 54008]EXL64027.1 hypothetical protein FOPG_19703 [Fusarium oxysporum f. sp. conglutinans race 2 54008]